jgi:hypothetical protein
MLLTFLVISQWSLFESTGIAQQPPPINSAPFTIESHFDVGALVSLWLYGPRFPESASRTTLGYNTAFRVMWHPDHLLAVGIYTGYQLIVAENYAVSDSVSFGRVRGAIHRIPLMVDESMQLKDFEVGVALGGFIVTTALEDGGVAHASHFELGTVTHASYHWAIANDILLGADASISFMTLRGILSFAPSVSLQYNPYRY